MNEDNYMGSMAQQALTSVNGGASIQTQPAVQKKNNPALALPDGNSPVLQKAFELAQGTITRLSRGLNPLHDVGGRLGNNSTYPMPDANRPPAESGFVREGRSGLMDTYRQIMGGMSGRQNPRPSTVGDSDEGGMTTIRPIGGGAAIPHYDYNGVMVALPDGVEANDSNAVGAAMAEQNALIDMMNGMNDEED